MAGTRETPWTLRTPSGQSEYTAYRDESADPPALGSNFELLGIERAAGVGAESQWSQRQVRAAASLT